MYRKQVDKMIGHSCQDWQIKNYMAVCDYMMDNCFLIWKRILSFVNSKHNLYKNINPDDIEGVWTSIYFSHHLDKGLSVGLLKNW